MCLKYSVLHIIFVFYLIPVLSQSDSTTYNFGDFGGIILLDSVVVSASKNSLDIDDFVDMVVNDESFFIAFHNIRTLSYSANNQIKMYAKKGKEKASYKSLTKQMFDGECRTMEVLEETTTGNFYKRKKKHRYYTAKMFDRIFFTHGKVCETEGKPNYDHPNKGMEKHVQELKKLIFDPGEKADVPLISNKTRIFSEEMSEYYNYSITSKEYKNGADCYVFSVKVKPEFTKRKTNKTVIKVLETYFEKNTFQVIARNYSLAYSGALFDFDVNMEIELKKVHNYYVPDYIKYNGWWDIPAKKPEISTFSAKFYDYH